MELKLSGPFSRVGASNSIFFQILMMHNRKKINHLEFRWRVYVLVLMYLNNFDMLSTYLGSTSTTTWRWKPRQTMKIFKVERWYVWQNIKIIVLADFYYFKLNIFYKSLIFLFSRRKFIINRFLAENLLILFKFIIGDSDCWLFTLLADSYSLAPFGFYLWNL